MPNRLLHGILLAVASASALGGDTQQEPIRIDADYPGGNIAFERMEGDHVYLHQELRGTTIWWFYWNFRVRGAAGRTLTFQFTNNDVLGLQGPAVSLDEGANWSWLGTKTVSGNSFSYTFGPDADSVRFCYAIPYQEADLLRFLAAYKSNPHLKVETLCRDRSGRNVERLHLGKLDGEPRYRVALTCRHHACEMMSSWVLEGILAAVLADTEDGRWFRENVEVVAVPFMDKDGVEAGDQGKGRAPHDHARDYTGEAIYPSVRALRAFLPEWSQGKLRIALDMHCPYIHAKDIYWVLNPDEPYQGNARAFVNLLADVAQGPLTCSSADARVWPASWEGWDRTPMAWFRTLPGILVATALEMTYSVNAGIQVTPDRCRAFGHDIARAMRAYLTNSAPPSAQPQAVAVHDTSVNPFIMPQDGKEIGDPFPSYWDGVWHVYTLSADLRQVYHLTSTDLVKWSEHAPAMVGHGIATGTVVRHEGNYYMFYTDAEPQTIRLVVSDNPWRFDFKKSRLVAKADKKVYQLDKNKFRDCYVFFNEAEQRWWMLIEATSDDRVAVGLLTSENLLNWEQRDPIFTDGSREHASCPQVFEHDGRWYLTLLDHNTWVYQADSLFGPWENAGFYHSTCFTAASRYARGGNRRLCWGFFTKRKTPEQTISGYAGPMGLGRELVFNAIGELGVRPLPELVAAIREPAHNAAFFDCARPLRGTWEIDAGKREFRCTGEDGGALLLDVAGENPDYYFEANIVLASPESRADVLIRTSEMLDCGYRIALDAGADEIAIRQAGTGGGAFNKKEYPLADGQTVQVQIFICDNQMEVFFDEHVSLSTRVLDRSGHRAGIEITGGRATIRNLLLHHFKQGD